MFIRPVQVPVQISVARLIFKETPTIQTTPHKKQVTETKKSQSPYFVGGAVSRFLLLSLSFICATYPLTSGGQPSSVSIFGFAGPGTVPARHRWRTSWALTSRFHPRHPVSDGSYFLLRFQKITPICAFRSRVPFPVRTFLTDHKDQRDRASHLYISFSSAETTKILSFCEIRI